MTEAAELIESDATSQRERNAAFVRQHLTATLLDDLRAAYDWHLQRHLEHKAAMEQLSDIGIALKNGDATLRQTLDALGPELVIWINRLRRQQHDGD